MGFLDTLIYGYRTILSGGVEVTRRNKVNFVGCTVADNPTTGATDVTPPGGGASVPPAVAMRSSAGATALDASTDYHLTMTGTAAVTLPAAPAAGTTFEVKAVGCTPTLTPAGGDTIEGAATYVQVAGECNVMRYNDASNNWELC